MAHGLPDYYRGVDIAYQALSELMVRPKYGGAKGEFGSEVVDASDLTRLCLITGKGMIYGGYISVDYTSSQKNAIPHLIIDDLTIVGASFVNLNDYRLVEENTNPFYLLVYDDSNFIYSVGLSSGYTFESMFKVSYFEADGGTPSVKYGVYYALI